MRFDADILHRIRSGEITATVRRSHGMRPSGYRVGHFYAIERVEDVRSEVFVGNNPEPRIEYEREVTKLEEWVEVTGRYRDQLETLRPDTIAAAGFESREELVDHVRAELGGPSYQMVWVIRFRFAHDRPRILAWPDTRKEGHDDYVHSSGGRDVLQGEPEAIDEATLARYAEENREADTERERKRAERWESLTLAEQVAWLEGAAAEGRDVHRALARVKQDVEAGRRRVLRRAA